MVGGGGELVVRYGTSMVGRVMVIAALVASFAQKSGVLCVILGYAVRFSSFFDHVYGWCLRRRPRLISFWIGVKITPISWLLFTHEHGSFEGSLSLLVDLIVFEITLSSLFLANQSLEYYQFEGSE